MYQCSTLVAQSAREVRKEDCKRASSAEKEKQIDWDLFMIEAMVSYVPLEQQWKGMCMKRRAQSVDNHYRTPIQ